MDQATNGTGRQREVAPRRLVAKALGGKGAGRRKTIRLTLHLDAEVAIRLGVHCKITRKNESHEASRILGTWLRANGKCQVPTDAPDDPIAAEDLEAA